MFSSLLVRSFFWLWRLWACGLIQGFSSCVILLLILLPIVKFSVVKPSKICYNSCWLSYCPTMTICCCTIFLFCQQLRLTLSHSFISTPISFCAEEPCPPVTIDIDVLTHANHNESTVDGQILVHLRCWIIYLFLISLQVCEVSIHIRI